MNFPSIRLEGAILTADLLDAIAREDKHSQKAADFGLYPSVKVKDEIASTWASAKALWTGYQSKITALHEGQTGVSETRNLFIIPLLALLGYQPEKTEAETLNGKSYAISHRDVSRDGFPLHIMGWHDSLEKKRTTGGPRISSHTLVQEYLNLTEHLYGIITNGRQLRLLRDSSRLIKLSFLEFDLNRIFEEDLYADFAVLFRLIHATRMPANRANASGSVIEKYHQESVDSGSRIRDGLAAAVAYSMQTVANGLLTHPANVSLVDQLKKGSTRAEELHQNLLRWVYRTLFVLVIEERVLHHSPTATLRQRRLYRDYYSLQRLRRLADRPQLADRRAHDLWRAMHQTLRLFEDGGKGLPLGIAPLGSFLFREEGLQQLFQYQLDNRSLLQALNRLPNYGLPTSLYAALQSFAFDYAARQKVGGTHLNQHIGKQLPLPPPETMAVNSGMLGATWNVWILPRVLELAYTAWDLEAFAQDCGWSGPPFRWDEERRFLLRCELDAAFFHLYLGPKSEWRQQPEALTKAFSTPRHAVDYILDTFPIVKRKDEAKFNGDYRTKRVILEIYDSLAEAIKTGTPYKSRLDPAPADPSCRHPKKKIGILAFGSLITDPGTELLPKTAMRIKTLTPFGVEYGRISQTRGGAPTLVPHEAGDPVAGEILVLDDTVSVAEAGNMLWRRERRIEGSGRTYVEEPGANKVLVREWADSPCVEHVLYTDFHPEGKIPKPQAEDLAKRAIQSVNAAKEGMDGITYLKNNLAYGVKTKLSADYEAEILKQTKASSLQAALERLNHT